MINWYLKVVRDNYLNFNGRARRSEYWYFILFNLIVSIVLNVIDYFIGMDILGAIYSLAVFLPGLAVLVRRLHDINKSGWYFFIVLIPLAGIIWLLVLLCTEGDHGPNQYGSDPKNQYDNDINEIGTQEV